MNLAIGRDETKSYVALAHANPALQKAHKKNSKR
jgi:hypothetical protein